MKRGLVLLLAACAGGPQLKGVPEDTASRDLACSLADEVGPRLAGSEGDARAVQWAVAKMTALGLQNVRTEPVTVPHWVRGEASAVLLAPATRPLVVVALGGSVATPEGGIEADVVRVESLEALRALPDEQVKGRIVFFDKVMVRGDRMNGYGKTVDVRRSGASEAAKKGGLASIIRSVGTSEARFGHTGAMRYDEGVAKIPAAALAVPDAERLTRAFKSGGPVRMKLVLTPHFEADAESANVIGEVVGASKPEELVVLGAHLDSWDIGDGAVDDAAGVAVVLDVASRLVKAPPARTVRVVLFANEENGLRGARVYAAAHHDELPRYVVAFEVDAGAGLAHGVAFKGGPKAGDAMVGLIPVLDKLGLPAPSEGDAGGADTGQLEGVPQIELEQQTDRYFDLHHTADDTCDKIHADELAQVTRAALAVTRYVAQAGVDLGRIPPETKK